MRDRPLVCDECGHATPWDYRPLPRETRVLCVVCHRVERWREWINILDWAAADDPEADP